MSNLTTRFKAIAKALTDKDGSDYKFNLEMVKRAYYAASSEGKIAMNKEWNEQGFCGVSE